MILEAFPPWLKPQIKCLFLKPFHSSICFFNGCITVACQRTLSRERNAPPTRRMYSHNDDFDIYMSITIVGVRKNSQPWHLKCLVFGCPLTASRFRECQLTPRRKGVPKGQGQRLVSRGEWTGLIRDIIAILCNAQRTRAPYLRLWRE